MAFASVLFRPLARIPYTSLTGSNAAQLIDGNSGLQTSRILRIGY